MKESFSMHPTLRPIILFLLIIANPVVTVFAETSIDTSRIDMLFHDYDSTHTPGVSVAVMKDGEVVYNKAFGMASLELGVPVDNGTVFRIGSVSKQFTAACIILLARDGALGLDDPLTEYVPELPPDVYGPVTIRHMLSHMSGIRDAEAMYPLMGIDYSRWYTRDMFMEMLARQKALDFRPGEGFEYSNSAYTLLALIVERVSGEPFDEFLSRRIFEPLGIDNSCVQISHTTFIPQRAAGYLKRSDGYANWMTNNQLVGHDAVYSTVGDLSRWMRVFLDGVLGDEIVAKMTAPGVLNDGTLLQYGSGLIVSEYKGLRVWCHSGWYVGYTAFIAMFPDQGLGIVCLSNDGSYFPRLACMKIADMFLEEAMSASLDNPAYRESIDSNIFSATPAETFAGTYVGVDQGRFLTLASENGHVVMEGSDSVLEPSPYSRFDLINHASGLTLRHDPVLDGPTGPSLLLSFPIGTYGRYIPFREIDIESGKIAEYVGEYVSDELGSSCRIRIEGEFLAVQLSSMSGRLRCFAPDTFAAGWAKVSFMRDEQGRVAGFDLDGFGFNGIVFNRINADVTHIR